MGIFFFFFVWFAYSFKTALPCFTTDKLEGRDPASTKVTNRVVSAFHRAKVRGALLQDTEDDENN